MTSVLAAPSVERMILGVRHNSSPVRVLNAVTESFRLEDAERAAIERALEATANNKERAAQLLGISRTGLYNKMTRLGLRDSDA